MTAGKGKHQSVLRCVSANVSHTSKRTALEYIEAEVQIRAQRPPSKRTKRTTMLAWSRRDT
eukprot:7995421-Alexandrium_andersonii.AAC.1